MMHQELLTTASCSFSSARWSSAAVNGRGCRNGPGPGPTPGSLANMCAGAGTGGCVAVSCGEGSDDVCEWFTAFWFEGRMLRDGEVGAGGAAIWLVDWRREAARVCGDGGTELRSGIPVLLALSPMLEARRGCCFMLRVWGRWCLQMKYWREMQPCRLASARPPTLQARLDGRVSSQRVRG